MMTEITCRNCRRIIDVGSIPSECPWCHDKIIMKQNSDGEWNIVNLTDHISPTVAYYHGNINPNHSGICTGGMLTESSSPHPFNFCSKCEKPIIQPSKYCPHCNNNLE